MRNQFSTNGHILKFIGNGQTLILKGKKCYPQQTYGVSQQSPQQFKQKNTLISDNSYTYKFQNLKQFQYPSQNNYFDVRGHKLQSSPNQLQARLSENSLAFHRKKGRLSQFMDKNGWTSTVVPIMGFERTEQSRFLSNKDRQKKIKSIKSLNNYQNSASKKPEVNQQYHRSISSLMSQKSKIRTKRVELNERQTANPLRQIVESQMRKINVENIEQKLMRSTKIFFNSTSSTFYNSRMKIEQKNKMNRRNSVSSDRTNRNKIQGKDVSTQKRLKSAFNSYERLSQSKMTSKQLLNMNKQANQDIMSLQNMNLQEWQFRQFFKDPIQKRLGHQNELKQKFYHSNNY